MISVLLLSKGKSSVLHYYFPLSLISGHLDRFHAQFEKMAKWSERRDFLSADDQFHASFDWIVSSFGPFRRYDAKEECFKKEHFICLVCTKITDVCSHTFISIKAAFSSYPCWWCRSGGPVVNIPTIMNCNHFFLRRWMLRTLTFDLGPCITNRCHCLIALVHEQGSSFTHESVPFRLSWPLTVVPTFQHANRLIGAGNVGALCKIFDALIPIMELYEAY